MTKDLPDEVKAFVRAIKSAIDARDKKYLMAHIPKTALDEVKTFLPGLSSPTVTTLHGNDQAVVIHVVVDKNKVDFYVNQRENALPQLENILKT